MALVFSIVILTIIGVILLLISNVFISKINKQMDDISNQKIELIVQTINQEIMDVHNLHGVLQKDSEIQSIIYDHSNSDTYVYSLNEALKKYTNNNTELASILFLDRNKKILNSIYSNDRFKHLIEDNATISLFLNQNRFQKWASTSFYPTQTINLGDKIITFMAQYLNQTTYAVEGYVLYSIKIRALTESIQEYCQSEFNYTLLVDEQGQVIRNLSSSLNPNWTEEEVNKILSTLSTKKVSIEEHTWKIFSKQLTANPLWRVVVVNDSNKYKSEIQNLITSVLIIGLFAILVVIAISYYVSSRITRPILIISEQMGKFEGHDHPEKIELQYNDELGALVRGYNKMLMDIELLIERIYKEENEKSDLELKALQYQLDFLQSQINPHFIHNTLNTVSYLAGKYKADDIKDLVYSLNLLLRSSMSEGTEFTTIHNEIETIRCYCKVQEYRYGPIIELILSVPDQFLHNNIPKMILQPLVENALFHGIVPTEKKGKIELIVERVDKGLKVTVKDNGIGMTENTLEKLFEHRESGTRGYNYIGLPNINERLVLYFGKESALKVVTSIGFGTCIEFLLPNNV